MVIVPVGADGIVNVYAGGSKPGTVSVLLDVEGYYSTSTEGSAFVPISPTRLIDTRTGVGTGGVIGRVNGVQVRSDQLSTIPAGAGEIVANVTVTNPSASGYLSVFPGDSIVVNTSNLNFAAGETVPNMVMVPTYYGAENGFMDFNTGGPPGIFTDLVVDMFGYFD
jgi:hypothetical protein